MINEQTPDFDNTPVHATRPQYFYQPLSLDPPLVSIITPYFNAGPVFQETVANVRSMSFQQWEWIIVDDGSTNRISLTQLRELCQVDVRVRVIRQENSGPATARNRAAQAASGRYLFQIDSDDLVEPTYLEKCLWFLETQPQFAFCNGFNIGFGTQEYLWREGFERGADFLTQNWVHMCAVIRREAHLQMGGYDEHIRWGHEDWDYWLNFAEAGFWGYTIPEYLTWYRRQDRSRINETEGDTRRAEAFYSWLIAKHGQLGTNFPMPVRIPSVERPFPAVLSHSPIQNPLQKPDGLRRILLIAPWLELGGSDKFNYDLIRTLRPKDYEFTIATTLPAEHRWLSVFAEQTPDIFCLDRFLNLGDYPRFLSYLIESRQIDAVLISHSELGYGLLPFLRSRHPGVAFVDYNHLEQPEWRNGGYPKRAIEAQSQLDLSVVPTAHLKTWMVAQGGIADQIQVVHCNIDAEQWAPQRFDRAAVRRTLGLASNIPVLLYVGRLTHQKRPIFFARILAQLKKMTPDFMCLVIGDGEEFPNLKDFVRTHRLTEQVKFMGAVASERVCELMSVGDILVLPSDFEGLALVLYEAMAMEVVPVAALVGGQAELVTADTGYLIPHDADEAVECAAYAATLYSLITNPAQRRDMAQRGRERILAHFTLPQMAEKMDRLITEAIQDIACQPRYAPDVQIGQYAATLAIELFRVEQLADMLWNGALRGNGQGQSFQQTRAWRAINAWWRFKNRVLPSGSRRRRLYEALWRILLRS